MKGFQAAARLLPREMRGALAAMPEEDKSRCEEFRLRRGQRASVIIGGAERVFHTRPVSEEDILWVTETATDASLHAAEETLARGYICAPGGVRVGLCGTGTGRSGLRAFSSLSVRVPREVMGCADPIWEELARSGPFSALLLSPPGAGKTTLLRELCRRLSFSGVRVCVADERGEVAAVSGGEPGFDLGPRTDVMTGVSKARAAMMLLRSMSPQVLAMDEITEEADAAALLRAVGCGVGLLATAHAAGAAELRSRPACRRLLEAGAFSKCVVIENRDGRRFYRVEAAS